MQWTELRHTLKLLSKNFGFSVLCVSALALGLGIVLPLYAIIDNVALKTIPLPGGDRYVSFFKESKQRGALSSYDAFHWQYFQTNAHNFELLEAWRDSSATVSDGEDVAAFSTAELTPALMTATQVKPLLGRVFTASDARADAEPVALISESVWQSYYAGRADIIGHASHINGVARTIIGVLPQSFGFPVLHRMWLPLPARGQANAGDGVESFYLTGILAAGASRASADSEIQGLQQKILSTWPEQYKNIEASKVIRYSRPNSQTAEAYLVLLLLGSIMLLVTTNISNLFVARSEERVAEMAIRSALGASTRHIANALLLESGLICVVGLALGLTLAHFVMLYIGSVPTNGMIAFWIDYKLNARMLLASVLAVLVIWCISGGMPAWRLSRIALAELMASSSKGHSGQGATAVSKVLVNLQLFIGCLLLSFSMCAVISQKSERAITTADSDKLHTGQITFPAEQAASPQKVLQYFDSLTRELVQLPEVEQVAFATLFPPILPYASEDQDPSNNQRGPTSYVVTTSSSYFETFDIGLNQGRLFAVDDTASSLPVVVIDQRLADKLWPGSSALGKRLKVNPALATSPWLTVIGVSKPRVIERELAPGAEGTPVIYLLNRQSAPTAGSVIVKSRNSNFNAQAALLRAGLQADRDFSISQIRSMRATEEKDAANRDFNSNTFYSIMLIAMYLTSTATYGLAARAANRRRLETGIRMALGADQRAALKVFLKDGLRSVAYGLGIGGLLSVGLIYFALASESSTSANALAFLLPTVLGISLLIGCIVMLANYLPARKIINMEPADALRYQ